MTDTRIVADSAPFQFPGTTGPPVEEWRLEVVAALCRELYVLAAGEDERAAAEAAHTPYWAPSPMSVVGRRAAAEALRSDAARLESVLRTAHLSQSASAPLPIAAASRIS
jgi:hypothetical protein